MSAKPAPAAEIEGPYYAQGRDVYKRAHMMKTPAGEVLVNAGFHVLKVTHGVDSPELIAGMLNLAQRGIDRVAQKKNLPTSTLEQK